MQIVALDNAPQHIAQLAEWHHSQWSYLNPHAASRNASRNSTRIYAAPIPSTYIALEDGVTGKLLGSASLVMHDMDTRPELTPSSTTIKSTTAAARILQRRGKRLAPIAQ